MNWQALSQANRKRQHLNKRQLHVHSPPCAIPLNLHRPLASFGWMQQHGRCHYAVWHSHYLVNLRDSDRLGLSDIIGMFRSVSKSKKNKRKRAEDDDAVSAGAPHGAGGPVEEEEDVVVPVLSDRRKINTFSVPRSSICPSIRAVY